MLTPEDLLGARILIVDDEPGIVEVLRFRLSAEGYENIRTTSDPTEAVGIYREYRPDLVFCDLRMPRMDGFQVIEALSREEESGYLPLLVMTAAYDDDSRLRAFSLGAKDFISKPLNFPEVAVRMRNLLQVRLLYNRLAESNTGLRHVTRRLQAVLDSTGDAIAMYDTSERLVFANQPYRDVFEMHDFLNEPRTAQEVRAYIKEHFQEAEMFATADAEVFADPTATVEDVVELRGSERRLLYRAKTPVREGDEVLGQLVLYRDASKDAEIEEAKAEVLRLRAVLAEDLAFDSIIGQSPAMREMFVLMRQAKDSDITILIQGESGTGKELVARAIHYQSNRSKGPFVAVNAAAIPDMLIESELFGHERGAFTGATDKRAGRFEQAEGGTIFLDEIGEMDVQLQTKLLRVLQEREISRVGGAATIPVDVRVLVATNQDLDTAVSEGRFREDLFYRIAAFPVGVPALRKRREDVPLLVAHFLAKYAEQSNRPARSVSPGALQRLVDHDWPGNVRELENAIQRAVLLEQSDTIDAGALPAALLGDRPRMSAVVADTPSSPDEIVPLDTLERRAIMAALQATKNNVTQTAQALGINRATLYRKLKRYGLADDE
jgi:DNA-binding NtrC family response regulator